MGGPLEPKTGLWWAGAREGGVSRGLSGMRPVVVEERTNWALAKEGGLGWGWGPSPGREDQNQHELPTNHHGTKPHAKFSYARIWIGYWLALYDVNTTQSGLLAMWGPAGI